MQFIKKKTNSNLLLILGCQRSGTSLLTAMLGRHPEINMLYESQSSDVLRLIGTKYAGNKLLAHRQIRYNTRASKFGHLLNRLYNFHFDRSFKIHRKVIYPRSKMSLKDYIDNDAKIITLKRDKESVVKSIVKRSNFSEKDASIEYDKSIELIEKVEDQALNLEFSELTQTPEKILEEVCEFLDLEFEEMMLEGPKFNFIYPHEEVLKEKS